jgi:hypothetical protein
MVLELVVLGAPVVARLSESVVRYGGADEQTNRNGEGYRDRHDVAS